MCAEPLTADGDDAIVLDTLAEHALRGCPQRLEFGASALAAGAERVDPGDEEGFSP